MTPRASSPKRKLRQSARRVPMQALPSLADVVVPSNALSRGVSEYQREATNYLWVLVQDDTAQWRPRQLERLRGALALLSAPERALAAKALDERVKAIEDRQRDFRSAIEEALSELRKHQ